MALGYALLHPARLERSIRVDGHNPLYDEMSDAVFGAMGVGGDLGTGFDEYLEGRLEALNGFAAGLQSWLEPSGPLGWLGKLADGGGGIPDPIALLDRLTASLESAPAFKESLRSTLYAVVDGLPDTTSARLSLYMREQFDAITAILESPLRNGRRDRAAHRGFRSAVTLRQVFGPYFEQAISVGIELDLRRLLKKLIDDLLARLDAPQIAVVLQAFASFRAQFDGLIRACGNLNASFSVSVSVDGPSGAPDAPLTSASDALAAPHPPGHPLWIIDLVTGVLCTFSAVWEMVRSRNFKGREADGVLNVVGILWQAVQTLMRAAFRDKFNLPTPDETDKAKRFGNWIFTDQGNLAINLLFRFLGSIHDMTRGPANWSLGFTPSMLKYYSTVMNTRATYLAARSYWYFHARKQENATTPASMNRMIWAIWGPWWLFSSLFGLMPAWENFSLETGLGEARTIVTLLFAVLLGPIAGYLTLWRVSGKNPFTEIAMAPDWPTFILLAVLWVLGLILGCIIIANLESDSVGSAWAAFIAIAVVVAVPIIAMPFLFAKRNEGTANKVFLHWSIIGAGLFAGGVLPYFLWWFYIDDGRDKLGRFEGKSADTSPYKLPYRAGENWMCGQGSHGMFSHYIVPLAPNDGDNHYAYDFNEGENTPALAARAGLVVDVVRDRANDTDQPNSMTVQHLSWVPGHDPGTDLERVLTHARYFHLSQFHAWGVVGDRIVQGYNLADIDNTGRSALNHLHFHVSEWQRNDTTDFGAAVTYPAVFADSTLRAYRNFPLITSWWPGGGHIDGKPMSMAFYESENAEVPPVLNPIRIVTAQAGAPAHSHVIEIDRRVIAAGALPASVTLRTRDDTAVAGVVPHTHTITLSQAALVEILRRKTPSSFQTDAEAGHTHTFDPVNSFFRTGGGVQTPRLTIANPPSGQLLATRPGPYRLVGDQLVIRVNDRGTDYFLFGAHRPAIVADVALDRGVVAGAALRVAGSVYQLAAPSPDDSARGTAARLSVQMLAAGPPLTVRAVPTIAIETRRRGRSASLSVTFRTSAARVASGSGAFDDVGQITPAQLAAHVDAIIKNGWPAAPAGLTVAANAGRVELALAGAPVDLSASSGRVAEVLVGLYDPATRSTRGRGPMPLATGRVVVGGTGYQVPLLASHAEVRLDATDPAFSAANLTTSPLVVTVLGASRNVDLLATDNTAELIARRINTTVEGVRAFASATAVVVQTVAAGSSATISASKAPTGALGAPVPGATAATPNPLTDSCAVSAETFVALVNDAGARATLPYAAAAVAPQARIDGGRLAVEVGAGHAVTVAAVGFTGAPPFAFTAVAGGQRVETAPLPASVALTGPAWLDFSVDTLSSVRVPLDGEAARIDLPPLARPPGAGETLTLAVNGGAPLAVTFSGNETSAGDVAAAIAAASPDVSVRVVYVLSIENRVYRSAGPVLEVLDDVANPSPGLPGAGFLRDRGAIRAIAVGSSNDALAVPANVGAPTAHDDGGPVTAFEVVETPAGADRVFRLDAAAGLTLRVQPTQVADPAVPDPLGFPPPAFAANVSTTPIPAVFDLRAQCRNYVVEVQNGAPAPIVIARTQAQVCGEPAMIRGATTPVLPAGVAPAVVDVTIVEPGAPDRSFAVNLAGAATPEAVAQAFNELAPLVRAWVVRVPGPAGITFDVLHVETGGGGTGWRLRLGNARLLLALGFSRDDVDFANDWIEVQGRGTVANAAAVTQDEIRALFARLVACTTGRLSRTLSVVADGANVVARSLNGPITVETEPAALRALLNVTETADRTTLAPGATLNADNGTIIFKVAGRTAAVAPLWGDHASVTASRDLASVGAADVAAMLVLLQTQSIVLRVDGVARAVPPAPATATTLEAVLEWISGQAPEVWVGLRQGRVTFESRGTGSARTVEVDFAAFATAGVFPAFSVLGFAATDLNAAFTVTGNGRGSVPRMQGLAVTGAPSLEALLRTAAGENASPQTIFDVEVDGGVAPPRIRLRTHAAAWTLQQPVPPAGTVGPASLPFAPPGGAVGNAGPVLETPYPAPQPVEPGLFTLNANIAPTPQRVSVLLVGQPARLPGLGLPASMAALNGRGFDLAVNAAVSHVLFAANAATTPAEVAAQIERQCGWTVRAAVTPAGLVVETVATGSSVSIALAAPPPATPNAITNDVNTGFVAASPLPVQRHGAGSVPNMDAVSAADFQAVLARAHLDEGGFDSSTVGQRSLNWRAYDALSTTGLNYATIGSARDGCMSAIEPIVDLMASPGWSRSLARAPAVRGSVALPAFAGAKALTGGTLSIQLNDNAATPDVAAPVVVPVQFLAGNYTARDVARRIHDELWARGIGQAAAFPDGTVVIESRVDGLAGSVRIPAPGTATAGPDQALLGELIGGAGELFGRGYPGAGSTPPLSALPNGGRSKVGAAAAAATWVFQAGAAGPATAAIPIVAGQPLADVQRNVDRALAAAPGGRIGFCAIGPDDTLYVEQRGPAGPLMMTVDGVAQPDMVPPEHPGDTPEAREDPAVGLRFTNTQRTVRFARDRLGNGAEADLDDCGWLRIPRLLAPAPGTSPFAGSLRFPGGLYWTAVRTDAAKTRDYHPSGDMIVSGGVDPADPTRAFVHRARYWVNAAPGQLLRVVRHSSGEFLLEVLF